MLPEAWKERVEQTLAAVKDRDAAMAAQAAAADFYTTRVQPVFLDAVEYLNGKDDVRAELAESPPEGAAAQRFVATLRVAVKFRRGSLLFQATNGTHGFRTEVGTDNVILGPGPEAGMDSWIGDKIADLVENLAG